MPSGLRLLPLRMNLIIIPLCAIFLLASAPAWAEVSREQAAAVAQQAGNGRVLSVDRANEGGRAVWRVKVLTARGEVRVILVDAATGRPF